MTGEPKDGRATVLPFPLNPIFPSTPVVSDALAEEVYYRVVTAGKTVRMVSAELNVSLQRVAAIVRLKTIEKQWQKEGKRTLPFLTKAVHSMLPVTALSSPTVFHEPINDLPAHPRTQPQHFVPISESRDFTRADAGAEFGLPAADDMIPHPELITSERERMTGVSIAQRRERAQAREDANTQIKQALAKENMWKQKQQEVIVQRGRWQYRIQLEEAGKVGFRYGLPPEDRKKGQVKIPTRVD